MGNVEYFIWRSVTLMEATGNEVNRQWRQMLQVFMSITSSKAEDLKFGVFRASYSADSFADLQLILARTNSEGSTTDSRHKQELIYWLRMYLLNQVNKEFADSQVINQIKSCLDENAEGMLITAYTEVAIKYFLPELRGAKLDVADHVPFEQDGSYSNKIEFPPHLKQAGIAILNNFSDILESKFPEREIGITIEQKGLEVTMTIMAEDGQVLEEVKQTLSEYMMVVHGQKEPEELLNDPSDIKRLKNKIELLTREIEMNEKLMSRDQREIAQLTGTVRDQREHIADLISLAHKKEDNSAQTQLTLREILHFNDRNVLLLLDSLVDNLNARNEVEARKDIDVFQKRHPSEFNKLVTMSKQVLVGAMGGEAHRLLMTLV